MGDVFFFALGKLINDFQADTFFETGTAYGLGVQSARMFAFRNIISVEIIASAVDRLKPAFAGDGRVKLMCGRSTDVMTHVLPLIPGNIIFWLDAHFPGADIHLAKFDAEKDPDTRLPLQQELELIKRLRPKKRDVILIDDLWIYERNNYEWGNIEEVGLGSLANYDSKFLDTLFAESHVAQRFMNHGGYLALIPKPLAPAAVGSAGAGAGSPA
jgi:hypothetical protein